MNYQEFIQSLNQQQPPDLPSAILRALWYDGKGDWDTAHAIAQNEGNDSGSLIHAYLHRKEGDLSNAGYWYSRAGRHVPEVSIEEEWEALTKEFLSSSEVI